MTLSDARDPALPAVRKAEFSAAEIGALAHLYRGEVYRSTVWRTRLDSSTNWAVVTTGIALSATYSSSEASPLPMVLVGLLVSVFLLFESRRYRYFNVWRARARLLETDFYAPMIRGEGVAACTLGLDRVAGEGLRQSTLSYQLGPRDRQAPPTHLHLDLRHPGHCILRQAGHPSDAADHPRRTLGTCRHWPDPGGCGCCSGSSFPWWLGAVCTYHVLHRTRLATRAAELNRHGIVVLQGAVGVRVPG